MTGVILNQGGGVLGGGLANDGGGGGGGEKGTLVCFAGHCDRPAPTQGDSCHSEYFMSTTQWTKTPTHRHTHTPL